MTTIAAVTAADANDLASLRHALWPHGSIADHLADAVATLAKPEGWLSLIARTESGLPVGFAEASIRHDYVNGCKTSPVGFLEGSYVAPDHRRTGLAGQLVNGIEAWVRRRGCSELASDTAFDNLDSQNMHNALGFVETQRVVYFRKPLA